MSAPGDHAVGLRELRHHTSAVIGRVRNGETVDVTDRGQLVARIVPPPGRQYGSALERLAAEGRLVAATRPSHRPRMRAGDGTDRLTDALAEIRDAER